MLIHGDHRVFGVLEQAGVACASILLAIELGHVGHRQDRRHDLAVLVSQQIVGLGYEPGGRCDRAVEIIRHLAAELPTGLFQRSSVAECPRSARSHQARRSSRKTCSTPCRTARACSSVAVPPRSEPSEDISPPAATGPRGTTRTYEVSTPNHSKGSGGRHRLARVDQRARARSTRNPRRRERRAAARILAAGDFRAFAPPTWRAES
jgi:hypothetical protein